MVNQSEIENETTTNTPSSTSTTIPEMPKLGGGNMILVLPNGKGNGSFTSFSFGPPSNSTNQQHTTAATTTTSSSTTTNTNTYPPSTATNTTTTNPTRSSANYFPTHQNPNPTIFLPESSSSTTILANSPLNIVPTNETHTSTTTATATTATSTSMATLPEPMLPSTEPPISNLPPFQIPLPHYSHDNNDNNDNNDNDNDNDNDNTDNLNDTTNDNDSKSDDDSDMTIDHTHPMSLLLPPSHTGVYQSSLLNSASNSENNMDNTPIRRSTRNRVPTRALLASQNINKRSNSKQSKKGQKGKARASSGDSSLLVSVMNHTLDISLLTDLDSTSDHHHHYAPHADSTDIGERLSLYNLARMWVADNPSATLSHAEDVLMDIKANVHNEEPHMELPAPLEVSDFTRAKPPTNMKTSPQDFDRLIRSNHGSNDTTRSLLDGHLSFYKTIRGWSQGQYNFRLSRYKERLEIITKDMSEM